MRCAGFGFAGPQEDPARHAGDVRLIEGTPISGLAPPEHAPNPVASRVGSARARSESAQAGTDRQRSRRTPWQRLQWKMGGRKFQEEKGRERGR